MQITDRTWTGSPMLDFATEFFIIAISGVGISEVVYRILKKNQQLPSPEISLYGSGLFAIGALPCSITIAIREIAFDKKSHDKLLFFGAFSTGAIFFATIYFYLRRNHFSLFLPPEDNSVPMVPPILPPIIPVRPMPQTKQNFTSAA